ncbi:MAG: HD domain-containing protein [Lachnospiraceae bacterium]|nr:HD domain-containing protein [Lachnospiraceae bacterium]
MLIDRKRVVQAFSAYVANYNAEDEKILLKIKHTYRVAAISEQIAEAIGLDACDRDLAWLIGMLHDIGRFEQLRRFGTFIDADSIDHAHFGVELLFEDGLLGEFIEDGNQMAKCVSESDVVSETDACRDDILVIKKAIWNHSSFRIEDGLSPRELLFAKLIRDADKIDILKVATDTPLEELYNVTTEQIHAAPVTEKVMEQFRKEQTILRAVKKVPIDHRVGHIALVFELEFSESYGLVKKQGYLEKLFDIRTTNPQIAGQFEELKSIVKNFLHSKNNIEFG